jgi:hypothetical protein
MKPAGKIDRRSHRAFALGCVFLKLAHRLPASAGDWLTLLFRSFCLV